MQEPETTARVPGSCWRFPVRGFRGFGRLSAADKIRRTYDYQYQGDRQRVEAKHLAADSILKPCRENSVSAGRESRRQWRFRPYPLWGSRKTGRRRAQCRSATPIRPSAHSLTFADKRKTFTWITVVRGQAESRRIRSRCPASLAPLMTESRYACLANERRVSTMLKPLCVSRSTITGKGR